MNKEQIKARILAIINNAYGYIIADEIYNLLRQRVDQAEHKRQLENIYVNW